MANKKTLKNKKNMKLGLFFIISLFFILSVGIISGQIFERGVRWDRSFNGPDNYGLAIYNTIINYYNGTNYTRVNLTFGSSPDPLFDYAIVNYSYDAYFKTDPTAGQVIKFVKDSLETTFQPMPLNYRNAIDQIEQISAVQTVSGIASENHFEYPAVYGSGIDLRYVYLTEQLKENLVINSSSDIPTPAAYIISGGNATLDLDFVYDTNAQHIEIDGVDWDKTSQVTTQNEVYIKDDNGTIIYYFPKPYAHDSNDSEVLLTYLFKRQGGSLYINLKTPYDWLNSTERVYPVYIDPTITLSGDGKDSYIIENKEINYGSSTTLDVNSESNKNQRAFLEFNLSSIPADSFIYEARLELYLIGFQGSTIEVGLHRLVRNWTESGITWNTYDGSNSWNNSGGDYDSYEYSASFVNTVSGWKTWDAKELLQELVNGTYENNGFILIPGLPVGKHNKKFASKENSNTSIIPRLFVNYTYDVFGPEFSNFSENPVNGSFYILNQVYEFNTTIFENNTLGTVGIEFNGVNYTTEITNISDVYTFNRTDLGAGTYSYYWWANDTFGNFNISEARSYTIVKATSEVKIYINNSEDNITITNNETIWLNASLIIGDSGDLYLYKNGTLIKQGPANISNLTSFENSGIYNITAYYEGDANYSDDWSQTWWVNVTDVNPPIINIYLPEQKTYGYNTSLALNYSVSDFNLESCWYNLDSGVNVSLLGCANSSFNTSDGDHVLYLYANDSWGNIGMAKRNFSVLTKIVINLTSPLDGSWTSNNNAVFEYTVLTAAALYNCSLFGDWFGWHLNQSNSSYVNSSGGNNNFSLFLDNGNYIWNVYCNGFYSGFAFSNYTFNIDGQDPVLNIEYPGNDSGFLRNVSLPLNFTVNENNLDSCYYSLDNGQTNMSLNCSNGSNSLDFGYINGTYNLTVYVNDSAGNEISEIVYNLSLGYDGFAPNLSLSEPTGSKTSETGIPVQFLVIDNVDTLDELNCWFNVTYTSTGGYVSGLEYIALPGCTSSSFNVPGDGDYTLYLSSQDITGNLIIGNRSFTVSVDTGGSGGGGGGGGIYIPPFKPGKLQVSGISDIIAKKGDKKTLSFNVRNIGESFLNNCKLLIKGEISQWFSGQQRQGIAPGENINFILNLQIPEEIEFGDYPVELGITCDENNFSQIVNVSIPERLQVIEINDLRQEVIGLIINYTLKSSLEEYVVIDIWLVNKDGIEIKRASDAFESKKQGVERNIVMELPKNLIGIFDVYLALSDDPDNFVKKTIVLGEPKTTGMVVAGTTRGRILGYLVFAAIIGVTLVFVFRSFIKKKSSKAGIKRNVVQKKIVKRTISSSRPSKPPRPPPPPPKPYAFNLPLNIREI